MNHPYASAAYAQSLTHIGQALAVPEWGGHVVARPTPKGGRQDAVGPYPLTVISADADVPAGLARLQAKGLVCAVVVLDDRLRPELARLEAAFDTVRQFKSHHVYDRALGPLTYDKHHRYEVKRAHSRVRAAEIDLTVRGEAWQALYGQLVQRHGLAGVHAFPPGHHAALATLAGVRAFGAFLDGDLISAHVFVTWAGYAVSHLAASAPEGYRTGAAYAVNDLAVSELSDCAAINFGGGAGFADDPSDGLVRFKRGFSNTTQPAWLCGKVLDRAGYDALSAGYDAARFFPAYRGPTPAALEPAHEHQG